MGQTEQSTYPVWVGRCNWLPNFIGLGSPLTETNPAIMGSEIAIEDPTLGGFWVEICHQFSALVHGRMQDLPWGVQLFGGVGELHAAKRLATRGVAKRLLTDSGSCFPEIFFNWCNLVCFGAYFHKKFYFKKI